MQRISCWAFSYITQSQAVSHSSRDAGMLERGEIGEEITGKNYENKENSCWFRCLFVFLLSDASENSGINLCQLSISNNPASCLPFGNQLDLWYKILLFKEC